jgi:ABC-type uncharacterized transport system substrate-binding protein
VAFLFNPSSGAGQLILEETERAAKELGLQIQSLEVRNLNDFDGAFAAAIRKGAHALIPAAAQSSILIEHGS